VDTPDATSGKPPCPATHHKINTPIKINKQAHRWIQVERRESGFRGTNAWPRV
jgi:hypothetical protein